MLSKLRASLVSSPDSLDSFFPHPGKHALEYVARPNILSNAPFLPVDDVGIDGVLVVEPGVTSLVINVPILGDTVDEIIETFFVNLFSATNGFITGGQARLRIADDDVPPSLTIDDVTVAEGPPRC